MKTTLNKKPNAFSLIELLMVLTIISIMAALIINSFSNASQDSRDVIARQQQAVLKGALDNAISQYLTNGGKAVSEARKHYNFANSTGGTKRTNLARFQLVQSYLDEDTYQHFIDRSTNALVRSSAMQKTGQHVVFEDWAAPTAAARNTYPKVSLSQTP